MQGHIDQFWQAVRYDAYYDFDFDEEFKDLINRLICSDPSQRLSVE